MTLLRYVKKIQILRIGEINEECDIFTTILDDSDLQTSVCLQHFQESLRILPTNRIKVR